MILTEALKRRSSLALLSAPGDLLRSVCEEFGLVEPKQSLGRIHDYLVSLNEFLLESYRKGENCALIIDEAQNLSAEVLESIRLLSNLRLRKISFCKYCL